MADRAKASEASSCVLSCCSSQARATQRMPCTAAAAAAAVWGRDFRFLPFGEAYLAGVQSHAYTSYYWLGSLSLRNQLDLSCCLVLLQPWRCCHAADFAAAVIATAAGAVVAAAPGVAPAGAAVAAVAEWLAGIPFAAASAAAGPLCVGVHVAAVRTGTWQAAACAQPRVLLG